MTLNHNQNYTPRQISNYCDTIIKQHSQKSNTVPTRSRIDLAGYHHVMNRGVDQMNIFHDNQDKDMFLQIVNKTAMIHKVLVHDYCLMDNHYHLLIETQTDNLSRFMRFVSTNYAHSIFQ